MIALFGLILIALSVVPQVVFMIRKGGKADPISHFMLLAAGALLLVTLIQRSIQINFVAITNTYEAMIFFSAAICIVVFVLRMASKNPSALRMSLFGGTVLALVLALICASPIVPKDIVEPMPALVSLWLVIHVAMAFIGESFFAIGFVAAINYLATHDEERKQAIDRIMYTTTIIGWPIFTAGALIFGAIWAKYAWGTYWGWDPKEIWALITWLVYAAFLHTRLVMKKKGRVSAIFLIIGFAFTIFTFAGLNFVLPKILPQELLGNHLYTQ